jgi:hypothetical protein
MPFGENGEHVTIRLIDFDDLERNQYVVTTQYTLRAGITEKRADLVLLVNGIPLVVIEAKTPVRASQSWFDAAAQIHDDYERNVPELFVPNVVSVATEGKDFRYGSIGLPLDLWGPWRVAGDDSTPALARIRDAVESMLRPHVVLDLLANFTAYATDKKKRCATPAIRSDEPDRRACRGRAPEKGSDLALPGFGQVAVDAVRRTQAAASPGAEESDRDDRCRPHRSRHADLQYLPRRRYAEPREGR